PEWFEPELLRRESERDDESGRDKRPLRHIHIFVDPAAMELHLSTGPALLDDARYRTSVNAVKDSFYVVPIGVEDECGVVPGVIVRSQPGRSVVNPSRLEGCGVERINRFAVWRGERNVHRTGRHFLFHDPEVLIVEREA